MGFWNGMIIGLLIGANAGIVVACLLAGCKHRAGRTDAPADWLHIDEAVMEDGAAPVAKTPRPLITASPQPFPHS